MRGSVVDPSGTPVPGAAVSLLLSGQTAPVLTTTTTLDGLFYITGVRPEYYDLAIESAGFSKRLLRRIKVDPAQETSLAPYSSTARPRRSGPRWIASQKGGGGRGIRTPE